MKIKWILLVTAVIVLASSCGQNYCLRKFPPVVTSDTTYIETVRTEVKYRDTTIYKTIPGEKVIDTVYIKEIKPGVFTSDTTYAETSLAYAKAWVFRNKLSLELVQRDTTIEFRLENALRETEIWKEKYTKIVNKEVVKVPKIPTLFKVSTYLLGAILIVLMFLVAINKFRK